MNLPLIPKKNSNTTHRAAMINQAVSGDQGCAVVPPRARPQEPRYSPRKITQKHRSQEPVCFPPSP